MPDKDEPLLGSPPPVRAQAAPAAALPTIRDHAERLKLERWQVSTIVARLHGEHVDGKRCFESGVDANTRMSETDFDAAMQRALHGR